MNDDWNNAPAWAQYRATDADGTVWHYESEPWVHSENGQWLSDSGRAEIAKRPCATWKDSLEMRPKEEV